MHAPASPTLPATVPVSFELSPARNGWIGLTVRAGDQSDEISCSDAFDPFQEIVDLMLRLSHGLNGCVEIDEEGVSTMLWVDREPGSPTGRFRVFEVGPGGGIETLKVDAAVDLAQVAGAWLAAFRAYVPTYDPEHWDQVGREGPAERQLAKVELRFLAASLDARAGARRNSLPSHGYPVERATPA